MKRPSAFLAVLALFIGFASAQDVNPKHPCMKVTSFSSSIGFSGAMTSNTDEDYYILKDAVENPDLFVDIKGLNGGSNSSWNYNDMYYNNYGSGSGGGNLVFSLGLTPYSKKLGKYRDNRELRFSVGGSLGTRNSFYYYDDYSFVIDTFQSINGSGVLYADSSISKHYSYSLEYSEINFGLSYLFKTDVNRKVHFYAGIGANYGIALRSAVSVVEDTYRSVYYRNEYDSPSDGGYTYSGYYDPYAYSYNSPTTNLKSPMQFMRAYIPLGLSLNLCKKPDSFFHHVDLYTELNPGVEFQILSPDKTYANLYMGAAMIGFNYHW
jgi:hypothetical protein